MSAHFYHYFSISVGLKFFKMIGKMSANEMWFGKTKTDFNEQRFNFSQMSALLGESGFNQTQQTTPQSQRTYGHGTPTWLGRVGPAPLGAHTVIPPRVGVLDKLPNLSEEFAEGHLAGLIDGVVEEGSPPQKGVLSEQDTVNACQPFLRGIVWLQLVLLAASPTVPWLLEVVNASEIMCACEKRGT